MKTIVLKESGYEEAALGFSLSYNSTIERAKQLLPSFAFKQGGENLRKYSDLVGRNRTSFLVAGSRLL